MIKYTNFKQNRTTECESVNYSYTPLRDMGIYQKMALVVVHFGNVNRPWCIVVQQVF